MLISVVVPYYLSQGYNRNTKRDAKHSASHFAFGEIYEKRIGFTRAMIQRYKEIWYQPRKNTEHFLSGSTWFSWPF